MSTAWIDRGFKKSTVKADVEVKSLNEVLPWLRRG
jgi:hypothetical protein